MSTLSEAIQPVGRDQIHMRTALGQAVGEGSRQADAAQLDPLQAGQAGQQVGCCRIQLEVAVVTEARDLQLSRALQRGRQARQRAATAARAAVHAQERQACMEEAAAECSRLAAR